MKKEEIKMTFAGQDLSGMIITDEMTLFLDKIENTDECVFLTGKAGTGKSSLLRYLLSVAKKNTVVAALTGVAAVNVGGITLHSLFQLPFGPYIPNIDLMGCVHDALPAYRFSAEKIAVIKNMDLLVIDEVSMLRADVLDAINDVLCHVRHNPKPFGGVQVLFIGDLYQLPPVVGKADWKVLSMAYDTEFFFSAKVLNHVRLHMFSLSRVFRQSDDRFIGLLNDIREGQLSEPSFSLLNGMYRPDFELSGDHSDYIMLTSHNVQADRVNNARLSELSGQEKTYMASVQGNFSGSSMPADMELILKVGARVMLLVNDNETHLYHNGSIGVITGLKMRSVMVELADSGVVIEVSPNKWINKTYKYDNKNRVMLAEEIGSFKQLPLRLAWAVTIHKSQGLTFDKVVVDAEKAFSPGQVYVALSRATGLEHLVLSSPIRPDSLTVNDKILKFFKDFRNRDA